MPHFPREMSWCSPAVVAEVASAAFILSWAISREEIHPRLKKINKQNNTFLNFKKKEKINAVTVCDNNLFSLGVFVALVSFRGTRDCGNLCGYLGNNRFRRGAARRWKSSLLLQQLLMRILERWVRMPCCNIGNHCFSAQLLCWKITNIHVNNKVRYLWSTSSSMAHHQVFAEETASDQMK